jgi:hypothetical protein
MDTFVADHVVNVELHEDNSVTHLYKKYFWSQLISSFREKSGHWTMVYDEGFELTSSHIKYFAFSKYKKVDN